MPGSHEASHDEKKLALVRLALLIKMGSEDLSLDLSALKESYEGDKLKDSAEETIALLSGNDDGAPGYIKAAKEVIRETGKNEMIFNC